MAESISASLTPSCDQWNDTAQEAARLKVSTRTMIRWRNARIGPPWFQVGGRILYNPRKTDEHLMKTRRDPVAEAC